MMSLWDALRMNMMISYQELVRTFPNRFENTKNRKCWYLSVLRDFQGKVRLDQLAGSLQDRLEQDLQ
ncbi:hypothetical protein ECA67_11335 [Salmonella enterica subsp. enterica]|nr:hypothetical protein [Salmonella enterica subsp. enterica]